MDDLIKKLGEGEHPLTTLGYRSSTELKRAVESGYVLVKFTDRRGGTELGLRLEPGCSNLTTDDWDHGSGNIHLIGYVILDNIKVRCIADVDIANHRGTGHLEII